MEKKKLELKKEVIAKLNDEMQSRIIGGTAITAGGACTGQNTVECTVMPTSGPCDINTIGHDEPGCVSARTRLVCFWCYGI